MKDHQREYVRILSTWVLQKRSDEPISPEVETEYENSLAVLSSQMTEEELDSALGALVLLCVPSSGVYES